MKTILYTKIGNEDFAILQFPFTVPKVQFRGLNLTVIVLTPLDADEISITCNRFINLSKIRCKKVSIAASTYISLRNIKCATEPDITTRGPLFYHSFKAKPEVLSAIWKKLWDSIEEVPKDKDEVAKSCDGGDELHVNAAKLAGGLLELNEAVFNYSPQRRRKY